MEKKVCLVRKSEIEKMRDFNYENKMKNINNYHPRVRFIVINSNSLVFTFWK